MTLPSVSISTEHFIKILYQLEEGKVTETKPGTIAKELGITNAAVTDMARKLATKKLIIYKKYRQLKLTAAGRKLALNIIRKHRLWETFLHHIFNLSMHEIHREADFLEHVTSDFLAEKISTYLGNPNTDPHGDPIPNVNGTMVKDKNILPLSVATPGKKYIISRLTGSEKDFFDFCHTAHLRIGNVVQVKKQYWKNRMTEITAGEGKLMLHEGLCKSIYVKNLEEEP